MSGDVQGFMLVFISGAAEHEGWSNEGTILKTTKSFAGVLKDSAQLSDHEVAETDMRGLLVFYGWESWSEGPDAERSLEGWFERLSGNQLLRVRNGLVPWADEAEEVSP